VLACELYSSPAAPLYWCTVTLPFMIDFTLPPSEGDAGEVQGFFEIGIASVTWLRPSEAHQLAQAHVGFWGACRTYEHVIEVSPCLESAPRAVSITTGMLSPQRLLALFLSFATILNDCRAIEVHHILERSSSFANYHSPQRLRS
jgi:hypothetical protein